MSAFARRLAPLASAILLVLALAHHAEARGRRIPLKPRPPIPYVAIASIDATAMTITTESRNTTAAASKTYKITPKTKVRVNGSDATLNDLKSGMQVRIGAGMDASVAEEISATPPPPEPK